MLVACRLTGLSLTEGKRNLNRILTAAALALALCAPLHPVPTYAGAAADAAREAADAAQEAGRRADAANDAADAAEQKDNDQ